jgi:hypothetical protein
MRRRHLLAGAVALVVVPPRVARAAEVKPYDAKAFAAAQEAGQSIVLAVNASW